MCCISYNIVHSFEIGAFLSHLILHMSLTFHRQCNVLHVFIATTNTLELLAKQLRRKSLVTRSMGRCIPVSMQQYSER